MNNEKKLFAFKLAEKNVTNSGQDNGKWKARDGVAIAGCTISDISPGFRLGALSGVDTSVPC